MNEDTIVQIFIILIIVFFLVGILLAIRVGFKSKNFTTFFGTTAELYNKDQKAAMEQLVEEKAKKKMSEQSDEEPY